MMRSEPKVPWSDRLQHTLARLRSLFHRETLDAELNAELESHIEMAIEEKQRQGFNPEEARRQTMIQLGGVEQTRQKQREARGLPWLEILISDLRYTMRTLRRDRSFAVVAVLILALGIGANIAVFSVVNTLMLRPLPLYDPGRLVWIAPPDANGLSSMTYSADAYDDLRLMNTSYTDVTAYYAFSAPDNLRLSGHGEPSPLTGIGVTSNFFHVLGVDPILGRSFTESEAVKGAPNVILLTYPYWKRQFGGDRSIVGKAITLDGKPTTVVGVLPESFDFGSIFSPGAKVDAFAPTILDDIRTQGNTLAMIGRMKPGVTVAQTQAEAKTLFRRFYWSKRDPLSQGGYSAHPTLLKDYVSGKLRRSLIVLWCAVGLILVIVCVNLSNLLLARSAARSKEFALRSALGAGRSRLIRQLLTESLVLSCAGAAGGLLLAYLITFYLSHQSSIALPLLNSIRIDAAALGWTLAITIGSTLLFGLLPGWKTATGNLQEALKDTGQGMSDGRKHEGLRSALVISEVALACVLLIGAGLLLRSFLHVIDIDLGYQPSTAAAIKLDYDDQMNIAKQTEFFRETVRRAQAIPGVEAAGLSDNLPLERNRGWGGPAVKGKTYRPGEIQDAFVYVVSPGYLPAMGMRLRGRDFGWQDDDKGDSTIILNETAAHALWPNEDAVGKMAVLGKTDVRVIGVIQDVHETNVEGKPSWQMYLPVMRSEWGASGATLVVRTKLPPAQLASSVMHTLREMNPKQSAVEFRPLQRTVDHAVSPRRFFMLLVSIFAGLGLILASLGIYGVISYSVTRRTQEIGIRMALGATPERVQRAILSQTLRMALMGIAVGLVASFAVAGLIASLLFGTKPTDPGTFAAMATILILVAGFAGYLPARRASRINPMVALRNE
ncbi:MAG: ABC transporter permease [Edaphobacter sp.]|uniref:ABC transporter permease n=1 Tax=Edaphobacter sp. TaxID=1934404 RepID=UPI002396FE94|nr:ABC transporter permease [Edaphobacter sp.]MDE1176455.1 ABC transporter permease [Edaphobacter sp.]